MSFHIRCTYVPTCLHVILCKLRLPELLMCCTLSHTHIYTDNTQLRTSFIITTVCCYVAALPGMARWYRGVSHRAHGRWDIQLSMGSSPRLSSLTPHTEDMLNLIWTHFLKKCKIQSVIVYSDWCRKLVHGMLVLFHFTLTWSNCCCCCCFLRNQLNQLNHHKEGSTVAETIGVRQKKSSTKQLYKMSWLYIKHAWWDPEIKRGSSSVLVTFYTCITRHNEDSGPGAFSFLFFIAPIIDYP